MTPARARAIAAVGKRRIERRLAEHHARRNELAEKLMRVDFLVEENRALREQIAQMGRRMEIVSCKRVSRTA